MTTDELRRLLDLAAKACGIQVDERGPYTEVPCMQSEFGKGTWIENVRRDWNPHTDDGDSARIRTALRMNVIWSDTAVHCLSSLGDAFESFADHNNDRNAALRLCALRVAAMIGEGME